MVVEMDHPREDPPVEIAMTDTVQGLRVELATLRAEIAELRSDLVALRESLGG